MSRVVCRRCSPDSTCETWARDLMDAVEADRTYERVRDSQCSSVLIDRAARAVEAAASCPHTPDDSPIWRWRSPTDAFPWVVSMATEAEWRAECERRGVTALSHSEYMEWRLRVSREAARRRGVRSAPTQEKE